MDRNTIRDPCDTKFLLEEGPLAEQQIENEYEDLDEDEDDGVEDEIDGKSSKQKRDEYEQILEAQEPATISQYASIKITPFNLEEELEDGEFDKAGNFIFKRESSPVAEDNEGGNDTWAESIDWAAVEREQQEKKTKEEDKNAMKKQKTSEKTKPTFKQPEPRPSDPVPNRLDCFKQMLRIMRPDETVQKAIRRLGNDVPKRRPNVPKRKQSCEPMDTTSNHVDVVEARRKLDLLIELAHQRLEDGDMNIYQKSYEDLEEAIN